MTDFMFRPLARYGDFSGRAQRAEYWWFALFCVAGSIAAAILDLVLGSDLVDGFGLFGLVFALAIILPSLSVAIRRLHDTDRSGWWVCLGLIPLIGTIILLIWYASDGTAGANRFGPDPKAR